jgi:hypothetical protein
VSFDVSLHGGEADGAYFSGHALEGRRVEVAVGSDVGPALLDLPGDALELGEHVVVYELDGLGHVCGRGGCHVVASYVPPASELELLRRRRPRRPEDVVA